MERFELPDGYVLHRTEKTIAITDKRGDVVQSRFRVKNFARDMHEHRPVEEALAAEVERLRSLLDRWTGIAAMNLFRDKAQLSLVAHPIYDETMHALAQQQEGAE